MMPLDLGDTIAPVPIAALESFRLDEGEPQEVMLEDAFEFPKTKTFRNTKYFSFMHKLGELAF